MKLRMAMEEPQDAPPEAPREGASTVASPLIEAHRSASRGRFATLIGKHPVASLVLAGLTTFASGMYTGVKATSNGIIAPLHDKGNWLTFLSPEGKAAVTKIFEKQGRPPFLDIAGGTRTLMLDGGTILATMSERGKQLLGDPASAIAFATEDPLKDATEAQGILQAQGFSARIVLNVDHEAPEGVVIIAIVVSDGPDGGLGKTVLAYRLPISEQSKYGPPPEFVLFKDEELPSQ